MSEPTSPARRTRRPDLLTLSAGAGALVVALTVLLGGTGLLPSVDARWLLAGGAIVIGVLLVAGSIRPRRAQR